MRRSGRSVLDGRQQRRHAGHHRHAPLQQEVGEIAADQAGAGLAGDKRRAGNQRHPQFLDREVERDRHALVAAVAGLHAVDFGRDPHEVADARMLDGDALRRAGGARGIDQVGELARPARASRARPRRAGRLRVDLRRGLVEKNVPGVELLRAWREGRHRHDRLHAGILQDEGDALVREAGVERNIGGIHLHHREQRDVGVHALVEDQADAVAGLDALLDAGSARPDWRGCRGRGRCRPRRR